MPDNTKQPLRVTLMPNQPAEFLARVVGWAAQVLVAGDVATIEYTLYRLSAAGRTRTAIEGHTAVNVPVADAINALLDDARWTKDSVGYNFSHTPDVEQDLAWSETGKDYLLEYTLHPTVGADQDIKLAFHIEVK